MIRTKIPRKVVIEDLKKLFKIDFGNSEFVSTEIDGVFHIDKREFGRQEVLHELSKYFENRQVEDGYVSVDNITMATTTFKVQL